MPPQRGHGPRSGKRSDEGAVVDDRRLGEVVGVKGKRASEGALRPRLERTGRAHRPRRIAHGTRPKERSWPRIPSGLRFTLDDYPEEDNQTVTLFDDLKLLMWTSRDEAYDRSLDDKRRGYRTVPVGRDQMEVWSDDGEGRYLITYSDMEMIENIERVGG